MHLRQSPCLPAFAPPRRPRPRSQKRVLHLRLSRLSRLPAATRTSPPPLAPPVPQRSQPEGTEDSPASAPNVVAASDFPPQQPPPPTSAVRPSRPQTPSLASQPAAPSSAALVLFHDEGLFAGDLVRLCAALRRCSLRSHSPLRTGSGFLLRGKREQLARFEQQAPWLPSFLGCCLEPPRVSRPPFSQTEGTRVLFASFLGKRHTLGRKASYTLLSSAERSWLRYRWRSRALFFCPAPFK